MHLLAAKKTPGKERAHYGSRVTARLLADAGIVRSRLKIAAALAPNRARCLSPESDAMSRDLLSRSFKFAGTTICYAFMQATGMVNDHLARCWRRIKNRSST